jgi:hypothetical protein
MFGKTGNVTRAQKPSSMVRHGRKEYRSYDEDKVMIAITNAHNEHFSLCTAMYENSLVMF